MIMTRWGGAVLYGHDKVGRAVLRTRQGRKGRIIVNFSEHKGRRLFWTGLDKKKKHFVLNTV